MKIFFANQFGCHFRDSMIMPPRSDDDPWLFLKSNVCVFHVISMFFKTAVKCSDLNWCEKFPSNPKLCFIFWMNDQNKTIQSLSKMIDSSHIYAWHRFWWWCRYVDTLLVGSIMIDRWNGCSTFFFLEIGSRSYIVVCRSDVMRLLKKVQSLKDEKEYNRQKWIYPADLRCRWYLFFFVHI